MKVWGLSNLSPKTQLKSYFLTVVSIGKAYKNVLQINPKQFQKVAANF